MSLHISNSLLAFAKPVKLEIDLSLFGPRQQKSFHKMLTTGICKGAGVPSRLAAVIRAECGAPSWYEGRYSRAGWTNMCRERDAEFFSTVKGAWVHVKLTDKNISRGWKGRYTEDFEAELRGEFQMCDRAWLIAKPYRTQIYKLLLRRTDSLDAFIKQYEAGEITAVTVDPKLFN